MITVWVNGKKGTVPEETSVLDAVKSIQPELAGQALAVLRATGAAGAATLRVSAESLGAAEIALPVGD